MKSEDWKDELFREEETPDEAPEETTDEAPGDTADEAAEIEETIGVVENDPFENAFQYTEPDRPKTSNWPVVVLAILLVLVLVGGILWSTGVFDKKPADTDSGDAATVTPFGTADVSDAIAATCGDFTVSNGAIAFFMEMEYLNSDQYSSYDKNQPLKQQDADAYEALVESAKSQFKRMLTLNASAQKNGTTLNKAAQNMLEKAVAAVDVSTFHNGVTSADVREFYQLYYTAWVEESVLFNKVALSEEDIEALYDEYAQDFMTCSVASYLLYVDEESAYTTVEEATEAAKALTACDTPAAFRAAAIRLMLETGECETEEEAAELYDTTYVAEGVGYNADYEIAQWLFAEDTAVGDTKLQSGEDYVTVYMLTEAPSKNTTPLANVHHIYLSTDSYGDEAALTALKDEILTAWEASDGTEEAFDALARQYTADFTTWDGAFWEFRDKPSVNEEFTNWCFDENRKEGDVGTIASSYGQHILYYVGEVEMWRAQVLSTVQNDASSAAIDALPETYPVTFNDDTVGTIIL